MEESDFVRHVSSEVILETLNVTQNGVYNAPSGITGWNRVNVNVPQYDLSVKYTIDGNGVLKKIPSVMDFSGVKDIGNYGLPFAYYNQDIQGIVNFPDLLSISGDYACYYAFSETNITSVAMPNLEQIRGSFTCSDMFSGTGVTAFNLDKLRTIEGSCASMFAACPIDDVYLPNLEQIWGTNVANGMFQQTDVVCPIMPKLMTIYGNGACTSMFYSCQNLNGMSFDSLIRITGAQACSAMFQDCSGQQYMTFIFPALRKIANNNAFYNMFKNCVNVNVFFPKNMQETIEELTGYSSSTPFGAITGSVLFTLPSTYILEGDSATYERNPIFDYDGVNSAWRLSGTKPDSTSFWIRGGMQTDPVVGTPIYSDRGCTIQVDTITDVRESEE